jgi:iron uptake system component EfeO
MAYASMTGDSLPAAPDSWSADGPTAENLATPFGTMWMHVHNATAPEVDGSVVWSMNKIAVLMQFPGTAP